MSNELKACSRCGGVSLHACPGQPIEPWPQEKVEELRRVLAEYAPEAASQCDCHKCHGNKPRMKMVLCPSCGNKRCPKASDHELACTGSNEPGQAGSIYGGMAAR